MRIFLLLFSLLATTTHAQTLTVVIHPPSHSTTAPITIHATIADTNAEKQRGLSHRQQLAPHQGMLFRFSPAEKNVCMWMKDTEIALTALFSGENNNILAIRHMTPQSEALHCAEKSRSIKYVLEITQKIGSKIQNGSRLTFL